MGRAATISLSKKEFEILHFLMAKSGHMVTHTQLLQKIWGDEYGKQDADLLYRTIDRLRRKLSEKSKTGWQIKAERGVGYTFLVNGD